MSKSSRERHVAILQRLLDLCPDMRLGQTVAVVAMLARPDDEDPVYHLDDDEFLAAAEEHLRSIEALLQQPHMTQSILQTTP